MLDIYTSSSVASSFNYFDQKTNDFPSYDSTQATVENQMAEVTRIANACQTYAGADKVVRVNDDQNTDGGWFAPLPNMQTEYDQLLKGEIPICNTSALAEPQKTEASGNYPILPSGYEYSFFNAQYRAETGPTDVGIFVAPKKTDSDAQLHCTINGCERLLGWGNTSLSRGQTIGLMDDQWSWNSEAIVIRGRAKTEPVAISAQANKSVYMANPYMYPIKLSDFVIKEGNDQYDYTDAILQNLIKSDLQLFTVAGSKTINLNSDEYLDIPLAPGDLISLEGKDKAFSLSPSHPIILKGKVTSTDSTSLSDVRIIFVSNDPNFDQSVEATTGADGSYTLSASDTSYNQALITKDGYQDTYIHLQNGGSIADITADIALAPGIGTTQIEMIPVRNGITTTFGLPFTPDNKFSVQTTAPAGNTDVVKSFELNKGDFIPIEPDKLSVASAGQIDQQLSKSTAVYDSNNGAIYHFGGIDQADSQPSTAIYAYSPGTTVSQYVADLPVPLYNAGGIFVPNQNLILIFGGQDAKVYGYFPDTNKIFTLDDISEADQFSAISDGSDIYVFGQSAGSTKIYKVSFANIATNLVSKNCYPKAEADCTLGLFNSPTSISPPVGFAPYYSAINNRIYFFGGNSGGQPTADIYSVNSDLADFRKETATLPFAVSDTAYFFDTSTNKFYLFGGNIVGGTTDKGTVIQINKAGSVTASNLPDNFKLTNATSSVAFAPDGQNNFFIFSSTAGLADPPSASPSYIQAIYPTATYKVGQVYSVTPTADYSLLVRSTEKPISEQNTISMSDIPDPSNYFVINKPGSPYYFSTSTGDPEPLYKYKITKVDSNDNVNEYNLIDAAKNGLIEHTVKINDRTIDVTILSTKDLKSTYVYPSDIFSFTDKADSVVSKDGDQINPDFDNGYQFIPKAAQALSDAGMSDDEISNVMAQLNDCDPISFYDINATDDQRNACIDSIQTLDDTSGNVSENTLPKTKSLLAKLIPPAQAASLTPNQIKDTLKQYHKGSGNNVIPPGLLRKFVQEVNAMGANNGFLAKFLGTTPSNYFFNKLISYKKRMYYDWRGYIENTAKNSLPPQSRGVMFPLVYNSLSSDHWLNVMQDKKNWNTSDLNKLFSIYWYPHSNNGSDKFTKEEKKAIQIMWQSGMKDALGEKFADQAFIATVMVNIVCMVPESSGATEVELGGYAAASAEGNSFIIPKVLSKAGKTTAIESVSSKALAATPKAWGVSLEKIASAGKPKSFSPKIYNSEVGDIWIDFAQKGKTTQFVSAQQIEHGYDNIVRATDYYTQGPWMQYMSKNGSILHVENRISNAITSSKILPPETDCAAWCRGGRIIDFNETFFNYDGLEQFKTTWHELEHVNQPGTAFTPWKNFRCNIGFKGAAGYIKYHGTWIQPFDEGAAEFLAQIRVKEAFGVDNLTPLMQGANSTSYTNQTMTMVRVRNALMDIHGIGEAQATDMIAQINYTQTWDKGIDTLLGSAAQKSGVIGPNVSLYKKLFSLIKQDKWTGEGGVYWTISQIANAYK